jgi:hypothetical protein
MEEGRAAQRALRLRCGTFLVLRENEAPAEMTRSDSAGASSPRRMLAKKWTATRPVFGKKPHRGPGEGTHRNGLGAQRTLLTSLDLKEAQVSSGPAPELFSRSVQIFCERSRVGAQERAAGVAGAKRSGPRERPALASRTGHEDFAPATRRSRGAGPVSRTNSRRPSPGVPVEVDCASLPHPASIRYRVVPARGPFGRSWSSGHQFIRWRSARRVNFPSNPRRAIDV